MSGRGEDGPRRDREAPAGDAPTPGSGAGGPPTGGEDRGLWWHAGWMMGGSAVQAVVAFLANLALVRLLTPEDFGRFAIVQANIGLVAAVINFRIGPAIIQAEDEELGEERIGVFAGAQATESALVGGASLLLLWAAGYLGPEALLLLAGVLALPWLDLQVRLYERRFEYEKLSVIETGSHGAGHVFAVAGAVAGLGALVLYVRQLVAVLGQLVGLWIVGALRRVRVHWPGRSGWRRFLRRIRGIWLDGVLERSFERLVILAAGVFAGERVTGFFYQARRLAIVPQQLLGPLTQRIAFNRFSNVLAPRERRPALLRTLGWEGLGLGAAAVAAWVVADPVVPWLFGAEWAPVVPLFRLMLGVVVGLTAFETLKAYFMAERRMRPFILAGRGVQYAGFLAAVGAVALADAAAGPALSAGLSASFLGAAATLTLLVLLSPGPEPAAGATEPAGLSDAGGGGRERA